MIATQMVGDLLDVEARRMATALGISFIEARSEAQTLLCWSLGVARGWLAAHADHDIEIRAAMKFERACARRAHGEPVAYITGVREFYGLEFAVGPDVLIPRPETEMLVELALAKLAKNTSCAILDLGTGSGAIAVTLARLLPHARVVAVDVSLGALAMASANAQRHGVRTIRFVESNWFANMGAERFDLIVSNPPYVAIHDAHLSDLKFEPMGALVAGSDGLACLREVIAGAITYLRDGGYLMVEHGFDQAAQCRAMFEQAGFKAIESHTDLAGIPRVAVAQRLG